MKEASYLSSLSTDIEKEIGGKVIKISDRSTLGLPDSMHVVDGIVTYIESKIGEDHDTVDGIDYVQPWKSVKKDIRQYEVCREISRHALVVYAIYWPELRKSAIIPMEQLAQFRPSPDGELPWLCNKNILMPGRGLDQLKRLMFSHRKNIHGRLQAEYGKQS